VTSVLGPRRWDESKAIVLRRSLKQQDQLRLPAIRKHPHYGLCPPCRRIKRLHAQPYSSRVASMTEKYPAAR